MSSIKLKFLPPLTDSEKMEIYNSTHSDSQLTIKRMSIDDIKSQYGDGLDNKIEWKTPSPQAYDGSTVSRLEIEDSLVTLDKINKIWHEMLSYDKPKNEPPYNPRFKNGINYRKIKI